MNIKIDAKLVKELMLEFSKKFCLPVYQGTHYCRDRLKSGLNCAGCESELGCVGFRLLLLKSYLMRIERARHADEN